MAGRSIILYAGSGGYILQETTAAVVNIRTQLCFVVIAGHDVVIFFNHQNGRAAGIPGGYIIPIAFIRAFVQGNSHFGVNTTPQRDIACGCRKPFACDI